MKKAFFIITCAIIIVVAVIACRNDEGKPTDKTNKFDTDLAEYVAKQKSILGSIVKTRSGESSPLEDLLQMAAKIDSCTADFVENHREELAPITHELTEDELEAMSYDEEYLLDFIQMNYSETVYNAIYNFINNNSGFTSVDDKDLQPSIPSQDTDIYEQIDVAVDPEKFILANAQIASNFKALVIDQLNPDGMQKEYQNKSPDCLEKYQAEVDGCNFSFGVSMGLTIIGAVITSPITIGSAALFVASTSHATYEYSNCLGSAKSSYEECVKSRSK